MQVGCVTDTVLVQAELMGGHGGQLRLTESVNDPAPSAVTVTDEPVVDPTIVPFPVMLQVGVHPAGRATV